MSTPSDIRSVILLFMLGLSTTASGHQSRENTARISIRDQSVTVHLNIRILDWLALVGTKDGSQPRSFTEHEIPARLRQARDQLLSRAKLTLKGTSVPLRITHFPTDADVRALLEYFAWTREQRKHLPHDFGWVGVTLTSLKHIGADTPLTLSLPDSLGPTHISLVKPIQVLTPAGGTARFDRAPL